MKVSVDENIPLITVAERGSLGHDVLDIRGTSHQGISDAALWTMASNKAACSLARIRVSFSTVMRRITGSSSFVCDSQTNGRSTKG